MDLQALLTELAKRGVNEVHVEAGQTLNGALLEAELIDELLMYVAPTMIGSGRGVAALAPLRGLADAPRFRFQTVEFIGSDLRFTARFVSHPAHFGRQDSQSAR